MHLPFSISTLFEAPFDPTRWVEFCQHMHQQKICDIDLLHEFNSIRFSIRKRGQLEHLFESSADGISNEFWTHFLSWLNSNASHPYPIDAPWSAKLPLTILNDAQELMLFSGYHPLLTRSISSHGRQHTSTGFSLTGRVLSKPISNLGFSHA